MIRNGHKLQFWIAKDNTCLASRLDYL